MPMLIHVLTLSQGADFLLLLVLMSLALSLSDPGLALRPPDRPSAASFYLYSYLHSARVQIFSYY